MRLIITCSIILSAYLVASAQQFSLFSNFVDNQLFLNPAYAGTNDYGEIRGLFRSQWVGVDGAPTTQYFGFANSLDSVPLGFGIHGFNDQSGQINHLGGQISLSYQFNFGENSLLSFGVSGGLSNWGLDQSNVRLEDENDDISNIGNNGDLVPMVNLGLFLKLKYLYLSIASPQILESNATFESNSNDYVNEIRRHAYALIGSRLSISERLSIEPTIQYKYFALSPDQLDLGVRLHILNFWVGGFLRTDDAFSAQAGIELAKSFSFYYGYDVTTSRLQTVSNGSHEIGMAYLIGKDKDSDGDGVLDREDDCPKVPGDPENNGCPKDDRDKDGIPDEEDECPDTPGLAKYAGCPDTDGDGIIDKSDQCPLKPGKAEFFGCPDTDGDGIPDHKDECPKIAGMKEHRGCPDTDGDGISDPVDNCPNTPGPKENGGCPWKDSDGDGLLDHMDRCPTIPGPESNWGCPVKYNASNAIDTDGDGITDAKDDCPRTYGTIANRGCPEPSETEQRTIYLALVNLEFEFDKSIILPSSYPYLDRLAELMVKKPDWKLRIAGHTDNIGPDAYNMRLSRDRAISTRNYLVARGMSSAQFIIQYFGETKPIDSNDTEEGRQRNRRVELEFIFD